MGVLQRFERRLQGLVDGAFAKAFKAEVQPVEIASALQRECTDRAAIVSRGRTIVPNDFVVELGHHDYERLSVYAQPLCSELASMVTEYAQEQGYSFVGPVQIRFERVDDLETGMFRVRSQALAGVVPMAAAAPPAGQPVAYLEINGARHPLTKPVMTIGRGLDVDLRIEDPGVLDVDLRIEDPGVSRRHAEIRAGGDTAIITDLGSTNGVIVDGRPVDQAPLRDGSVIILGNTTLIFRTG
ncbi:FhaA domain-containing protein [Carbonactinospora thermoautotrophica]|uniref:FhaA domain-containing protein n=1 Tax=Carbonactinospora thermoautotrophica TaxID=1469144 RepID=UPI003DA9E53E